MVICCFLTVLIFVLFPCFLFWAWCLIFCAIVFSWQWYTIMDNYIKFCFWEIITSNAYCVRAWHNWQLAAPASFCIHQYLMHDYTDIYAYIYLLHIHDMASYTSLHYYKVNVFNIMYMHGATSVNYLPPQTLTVSACLITHKKFAYTIFSIQVI